MTTILQKHAYEEAKPSTPGRVTSHIFDSGSLKHGFWLSFSGIFNARLTLFFVVHPLLANNDFEVGSCCFWN